MLKDFKQFVPSSVCLKCDGCCRFKEHNSLWRPYVAPEEKDILPGGLRAENTLGSPVIGSDAKISVTKCGQGFVCYFFNSTDNTCNIYHARPFECQLYPFLLGKQKNRAVLYAHLSCPYIQEHFGTPVYQEYTRYLKEFFEKKDGREFVKRNFALLTDYTSCLAELDCVCDLVLE